MAYFEILQKWDKKPQDIKEWYQAANAENMELEKQAHYPADLIPLSEQKRIKREKRKLTIFLLLSAIVCAAVVLVVFGVTEAMKMRGMTFALRNESLPIALPFGKPQLRTIALTAVNRPHGLFLFSPFVASSQIEGRISIITNYTNPSYHAYTVRHPEINDVVVITDAFFCQRDTCFWIKDVHNVAYFGKPVTRFLDLTRNLVKVPLPSGVHFVRAEYCAMLYDRSCRIVTQTDGGQYHYAVVVQDTVAVPPVIEYGGPVRFPQTLPSAEVEVRAFRTLSTYERLVAWYDGQLAFISNDNRYDRSYATLIDDVSYDETVEIHGIADGIWAVLVMKEEEDMRTKVRIYIIRNQNTIIRYDELTIFNRRDSINIVRRNDSFEICELAGLSHLKCYTNVHK